MVTKTKRPWHLHEKFGTYRFFNVPGGREETGAGHSYVNRGEINIAAALYNRLRREFTDFDFDSKIGIISMYRGQIVAIRRAFEEKFGPDITSLVDFNTVDGFQGQEKDIVILSCVRAGPGVQSVGFLRGKGGSMDAAFQLTKSANLNRHQADERRIDTCEVLYLCPWERSDIGAK